MGTNYHIREVKQGTDHISRVAQTQLEVDKRAAKTFILKLMTRSLLP